MIPEPRNCPADAKNVNSGIPNKRERMRNWIKNIAEKKKHNFETQPQIPSVLLSLK